MISERGKDSSLDDNTIYEKCWQWTKSEGAGQKTMSGWTSVSVNHFQDTIPPGFSATRFSLPVHPHLAGPAEEGDNFDLTAQKPQRPVQLQASAERYMTAYFTESCRKNCPGVSCIYTHHNEPLRRKPVRLGSGHYGYTNVKCVRVNCIAENCPFAHSSEELLYHPEQYKTTSCGYGLNGVGICAVFGLHCPFAHSPSDLRVPAPFNVLTPRETKPTLTTVQAQERWAKQLQSLPANIKKPIKAQVQADVLDVSTYKTMECARANCKISPCPNYHNSFDRRRNPKFFSYISIPCKNVFDVSKKKFTLPAKCTLGDSCHFSHTKYESYYHPQFYKTQICSYYVQYGNCKRGAFCAFIHAQASPATEEMSPGSLSMLSTLLGTNQQLAKDTGILKCQVEAVQVAIKALRNKIVCRACNIGEKSVYMSCGDLLCSECVSTLQDSRNGNVCLVCGNQANVMGFVRL